MHTMKNKTYSLDFVSKLGIITKNMNDIRFKECPIFISLPPPHTQKNTHVLVQTTC
jgi:hypothetical protein